MVLKNSISAEKWNPVAEADLCNRSAFGDLTGRNASAYPEKFDSAFFNRISLLRSDNFSGRMTLTGRLGEVGCKS